MKFDKFKTNLKRVSTLPFNFFHLCHYEIPETPNYSPTIARQLPKRERSRARKRYPRAREDRKESRFRRRFYSFGRGGCGKRRREKISRVYSCGIFPSPHRRRPRVVTKEMFDPSQPLRVGTSRDIDPTDVSLEASTRSEREEQ